MQEKNWIDNINNLKVCIAEIIINKQNLYIANVNNCVQDFYEFLNIRDLLFARYKQLGGQANNLGQVMKEASRGN